jgi:hypothetical protein
MRYYNSKNIEREYVVVKHQLRVDTELLGVRYREGYGVVAKGSKEYCNLKQIRMAITAEYPLTLLKNLKCVTNSNQVKVIWGAHVYKAFMQALKNESHKVAPIEAIQPIKVLRCDQTTKAGEQCKNTALSNTCFCKKHIHFDTRIADKLIAAGDIEKAERARLIEKWITELD